MYPKLTCDVESTGVTLKLTARARQFSSFILLLGRIPSADVFEPQYATIVQNKDDFEIPLFLETVCDNNHWFYSLINESKFIISNFLDPYA